MIASSATHGVGGGLKNRKRATQIGCRTLMTLWFYTNILKWKGRPRLEKGYEGKISFVFLKIDIWRTSMALGGQAFFGQNYIKNMPNTLSMQDMRGVTKPLLANFKCRTTTVYVF